MIGILVYNIFSEMDLTKKKLFCKTKKKKIVGGILMVRMCVVVYNMNNNNNNLPHINAYK